MSSDKNEFDEFSVEDDSVPTQQPQEVPGDSGSMVDSGGSGIEYDWNNAPETTRAPDRTDLNGQTITVEKADIILPPRSREWMKSRDGKVEYKMCSFKLFYSKDLQQEFYSGVRVFKRDVDGQIKYSHPSIMTDRKNQASKLLGEYADYKKKDITVVSLKEFMAFLNSKPKAVIKTEAIKNPTTNKEINKNLIEKFVEG